MLWNDLLRKTEKAKQQWEAIKSDLGSDHETKKFLSKSYLTMCSGSLQMRIKTFMVNFSEAILGESGFLKKTALNTSYIKLCQLQKNSKDQLKNLKLGSHDYNKALKRSNTTEEKLAKFDMAGLKFIDDIDIEVRFPVVRMETIQQIKKHHLVDSSRTSLSMASIRVVLKTD